MEVAQELCRRTNMYTCHEAEPNMQIPLLQSKVHELEAQLAAMAVEMQKLCARNGELETELRTAKSSAASWAKESENGATSARSTVVCLRFLLVYKHT